MLNLNVMYFRLKYGLYTNKSPVVIVNFVGCCLHSSYTVCYYLYTQRSRLQIQKQVSLFFFHLIHQFQSYDVLLENYCRTFSGRWILPLIIFMKYSIEVWEDA